MAAREGTAFTILGVVAVILLFLLIMGLAGTVDVKTLKAQFDRKMGICCGLLCQFLLMPFISFLAVSATNPPEHVAITLMIVCSSSGGAYSNWWCSLFNADLALSVAMTAVSTLISAAMLPVNLTIYIGLLNSKADLEIPWGALMQGVGTVAVAVTTGIAISTRWPKAQGKMARIGNGSGIAMVLLTAMVSIMPKQTKEDEENVTPLWGKEASFYGIVAMPFVAALLTSLLISSMPCLRLARPERVAITIEVCYQNVGIASAVALAAFNDSPAKRADAVAVPVIYGLIEAVCLAIFCVFAWKAGWTYAPAKENICKVISTDYQPRTTSSVVAVTDTEQGSFEEQDAKSCDGGDVSTTSGDARSTPPASSSGTCDSPAIAGLVGGGRIQSSVTPTHSGTLEQGAFDSPVTLGRHSLSLH